MANHVSHAALPYPIKNARFTIPVPYLDATGTPTDPTTPDTEVSKDAGAFADCAEEVSTISGSNGFGYITLTGAETDCSLLVVAAKVASGPKATLLADKPRVLPIVESGTAQAGAAGSITLASGAAAFDLTGCFVRTTGGTGGGGTGGANNQARLITAYNTSTKVATVSPNWETNPSSDTTYDILLPESLTMAALKALLPTTLGRTLDVSAGGEAGVDWANVGSPTTVVGLSGTTVKTATDVETDTQDIQSRLPAALTGDGNIKADVMAISGDSVAADNLEAAADGTGYNLGGGSVVAASVTASVTAGTVSDKTGYSLSSAGIQAIWDALTSALTTASSIGKLLVDNINATISSRLASSAITLDGSGRVQVQSGAGTGQIDLSSGKVALRTEESSIAISDILTSSGSTDTVLRLGSGAAVNDVYNGCQIKVIANSVWQIRTIVDYEWTGSERLATLDRPLTAAPAGSAPFVILIRQGERLGADIGAEVSSDSYNLLADALLDRDMSVGSDSGSATVRTVRQALRVLRNKVSVALGKVYKEDDTTESWSFATTTNPSAEPITEVDPASS